MSALDIIVVGGGLVALIILGVLMFVLDGEPDERDQR